MIIRALVRKVIQLDHARLSCALRKLVSGLFFKAFGDHIFFPLLLSVRRITVNTVSISRFFAALLASEYVRITSE